MTKNLQNNPRLFLLISLTILIATSHALGETCIAVDFDKPAPKTETRNGCFLSVAMGNSPVHYSVTFPAGYKGSVTCGQVKYPYGVFLHGRGANQKQFQTVGGAGGVDAYLEKAGSQPYLIVSPSEPRHSYWKNGPGGKFNTAEMISKDLTTHIEKNRCVAKKRCLMGISMGGHGVTYLKFKYPSVFPSAYAIAPIFRGRDHLEDSDQAAYGGANYDPENPMRLFEDSISKQKVNGRRPKDGFPICCGFRAEIAHDDDFIKAGEPQETRESIEELRKACGDKHVSFSKSSGGHDNPYFTPALGRAIQYCGDVFAGKIHESECQSGSPHGDDLSAHHLISQSSLVSISSHH